MTRREFVAGVATATVTASAAPPKSTMGLSPDCFGISKAPRTIYEYLDYCHERGAGGCQGSLNNFEPEYLKKVRQRAEQYGMYWEVSTMLPRDDQSNFEQVITAAKEAGAWCIRSVCLSGRRYETFNTLDDWKKFVADSKARLTRAVRICEKVKFPLGLENHKDWIIDEMVPLLKSYSSDYLGVCYDWGNNVSLLDDPMETVEALAPFIVNNHIKDMGVEEYEDGFLLAEVPMGHGIFDMKKMLAIVLKHRPITRFSLDMLTRDPLKIPCFTEKYWATFPERNGRFMARTIAMVRANKPKKPIPRMGPLTPEQRIEIEQGNVAECLRYAREGLGLV